MTQTLPHAGEQGEQTTQRGPVVYFYRAAHGRNATNGGISSRHAEAVVTGTVYITRDALGHSYQFEPMPAAPPAGEVTDDRPAVWLLCRQTGSDALLAFIPAVPGTGKPPTRDELRSWAGPGRWMFGGNFAYLPNSIAMINFYGAIAVHDRTERGPARLAADLAGAE